MRSYRYRFQIGNYIVSQSLWDGNEFVLEMNRTIRFFAPPLEAILDPLRKRSFCGFVAAFLTSHLDAQSLKQLPKSDHTVSCTSMPCLYSRILKFEVLRGIIKPEDILRHQFMPLLPGSTSLKRMSALGPCKWCMTRNSWTTIY